MAVSGAFAFRGILQLSRLCLFFRQRSPLHPDSVTTWLDRFSKRHDLPHINTHAFRHTAASLLYFGGLDSVTISARLGHAQVSTTADIYAHVMEEADRRSADVLADMMLKNA